MTRRVTLAPVTFAHIACAGAWVAASFALINGWTGDYPVAARLAVWTVLLTLGALGLYLMLRTTPPTAGAAAIAEGPAPADPSQSLTVTAFDHSHEGILVTDEQRRIMRVNPAFTSITGYTEAEVLGRNPRVLSSGRHGADFYAAMWDSIERHGAWQGEIWNRRKDGSLYAELLSVARVSSDCGSVRNYVGVFADITERERAVEQVQRLAHYDPLTGLPNRALLVDRANQALALARRENALTAVLFLDLDHFKAVNDSLGHRVGDLLLIEVARRLQSVVREYDTVSRQGGDEFVIVLPGTRADGAASVAEKIRLLIAQPVIVEEHRIEVTTSIGISMFPADGGDFDALANAADTAMYRAKQEGRNAFRFYLPDMQVTRRDSQQRG